MLKQDTNYLDYCRTFHHKHTSYSLLIASWTLIKSMRKSQDVLHQLITLKLGLLSMKTFISGQVHAKIHFWQICLLTQLWNSQLVRLWAWFTRQIWPHLTINSTHWVLRLLWTFCNRQKDPSLWLRLPIFGQLQQVLNWLKWKRHQYKQQEYWRETLLKLQE